MKIITYSTNEDVISGLVAAGQLREGATEKTLFSALLVIPALACVKATSKTGKLEVVKSEHTPTPWHIESVAVGAFKSVVSLVSATEGKVTNITCTDEDIKFIIRAVNAHDALFSALKFAQDNLYFVRDNPKLQPNPLVFDLVAEALKLALGE